MYRVLGMASRGGAWCSGGGGAVGGDGRIRRGGGGAAQCPRAAARQRRGRWRGPVGCIGGVGARAAAAHSGAQRAASPNVGGGERLAGVWLRAATSEANKFGKFN